MVLDLSTTTAWVERGRSDPTLRRRCGWSGWREGPSEATFSRAFQEFAEANRPARRPAVLIEPGYADQLVGPISREATTIEAREKPAPQEKGVRPKRKRGRPRQGEERPKEQSRLDRQRTLNLEEMLAELPKPCTVGVQRNAKGYKHSWTGYKRHVDVADGGIPIRCMVSSASLHDRQAAIPLMTKTAQRVRNRYDRMDRACDAQEIHAHSERLGPGPIIDPNPRRHGKAERSREQQTPRAAGLGLPHRERYQEHLTVERAFGRLKDELGGRPVRVRGHTKVTGHLMFGGLALPVDQLLRLWH